jgi:hypothetical protein
MTNEDLIQKVRAIEEISEDARTVDSIYLWSLERLPSQPLWQRANQTVYWLVAEAYKAGYGTGYTAKEEENSPKKVPTLGSPPPKIFKIL